MAKRVATKEALKKLDEQLECSLCLDTFNQPKVLPCHHVFCKSPCLEKLVAMDGRSLTCPTCRHIVPLFEKGLTGLQSAFYISQLLEVRDAFDKVSESSDTQCGSCENGKPTGYCQNCGDFLCDECQAAHKKMKQLKGHKLVSLNELGAEATNLVPPKKAVPNCPKHPENALKIYCETCSVLICTDCTVCLHRDHNYDLVADVLTKHKEELVSSLKPVREKLDKVQQALKDFETRAKEISDQRATLEADIYKEIDQQHQLLDQRRAELVNQLEILTQQKLKSLAAQRDKVEIIEVKMTSCLQYAEGLKTGTDGEVLALKAPLLKKIEQISTEFDPNTLQPKTIAGAELVTREKEQLKQSCQKFLEIVDFTKVLSLEQSHITGDGLKDVKVEQENTVIFQAMTKNKRSFEGELTFVAELKHKSSGKRLKCNVVEQGHGLNKISYRPVSRGKHELHLTVNGYPVRGSPFPISVAPSPQSLGKPVRAIRGLNKPRGTAVNSKRQIIAVVEGGASISILTPEGQKIRTFGTQGTKKGQLSNAWGVTVDRDDNIYVADNGNHRIQKFNRNGEFVAAVGKMGKGKLQFSYPLGICYNHRDNNMYVSDQWNHRIQVLTTGMKLVRCFGKRGSGSGELCGPYDIRFDNANNIYVADYINNRVAVFTAEGHFLRAFSLKANGQKLNKPCAIAIDSANTVYVSENGLSTVSIFTPQGDYITMFGSEGSKEGEFNSIYGLSVDTNNSIIVSDWGNGRLQIY